MKVTYLDLDGGQHTVTAEYITFGIGFLGNQCDFLDSETGSIVEIDSNALLEIRVVP